MRIRLRLAGNSSLKGKRKVVKSLAAQLRNKFNVSVSEVGLNDVLQDAEIGIVTVGNSASFVNSVLDKVMDFVDKITPAEIINSEIELVHMGTEWGTAIDVYDF